MTVHSKSTLALVAVALVCIGGGCRTRSGGAKPVVRTEPVLVQAFYPFNSSHKYIVDYVKSLGAKYPGKVRTEVYDTQSTEGRKLWAKTGLACAGVFVNGRTRHTIARAGGKKETVDFIKRMNDWWSKADFETVLKAEIAHPSAPPKGGFSTTEPGAAAAGKKPTAGRATAGKPAAKAGK